MAESFSRQKSRHAPQKEGGLKILSNELDVQNGWEENTQHTTHMYVVLAKKTGEPPPSRKKRNIIGRLD